MKFVLFLASVALVLIKAQRPSCEAIRVCDCDANAPNGYELSSDSCGCDHHHGHRHHHHRHQHIDIAEAAENGFRPNPYANDIFADCPRCHGKVEQQQQQQE